LITCTEIDTLPSPIHYHSHHSQQLVHNHSKLPSKIQQRYFDSRIQGKLDLLQFRPSKKNSPRQRYHCLESRMKDRSILRMDGGDRREERESGRGNERGDSSEKTRSNRERWDLKRVRLHQESDELHLDLVVRVY